MKQQRLEWTTILRWLLLVGLVPALMQAQEATTTTAAADASGDVSLGQLWAQGGWAMYPLALFSMAAFGLIVFNAMAVREQSLLRPDVTTRLDEALKRSDLTAAKALCEEQPCLVANITAAGLARVKAGDYDAETVEKAMEEASVEEIAGPFAVISYLSIIATLAPMVGMLGTVSGMIKAFRNIALGGMGKPELLADNISEALITTAVGLVVGIPAMFAFFFFKSRYARLTSRLARICGDLHHTLTHTMKMKGGGA